MRQPLGQHFLRDGRVIQIILEAAELKKTDTALEIGPGKAVLTEPLAARVAALTAVELDAALAEKLQARFQGQANVRIVHRDFLKADLNALFASPEWPVKVLGNIPYSITAPIFEKLFAWPGWETGVFLIQREVAERLQASAGTKAFGLLSLAVQLFATVEIMARVPPEAFAPPPDVDSSVVRLRRKTQPALTANDAVSFFDFARAAFAHRRKTIANSLAMATAISKKEMTHWLQSQGINPQARAEAILFAQYLRIAKPWAIFRREMQLTAGTATSTISEPF